MLVAVGAAGFFGCGFVWICLGLPVVCFIEQHTRWLCHGLLACFVMLGFFGLPGCSLLDDAFDLMLFGWLLLIADFVCLSGCL